jgi:predicted nucleic acid-binding protein
MAQRILVDTGVWYAMFAKRDHHAKILDEKAEYLESPYTVIVPWPTVYEALRTKFVKDHQGLDRFEKYLKRPNVEFFEAEHYRENAFDLAFELSLRRDRPMSMVDCLIRLIIVDTSAAVDGLITFNDRDFHDVCTSRNISLL